jgi:hypothetical protein
MDIDTDETIENLLVPPEKGYNKSWKTHIIKQSRKRIEELTLVSLALPNNALIQILTEENLHMFFRALFRINTASDRKYMLRVLVDKLDLPKQKREKFNQMLDSMVREEELSNEDRLRILRLCDCALGEIGNRMNAARLAPAAWNALKKERSANSGEAYGLKYMKALRIEAFSSAARNHTKKKTHKSE